MSVPQRLTYRGKAQGRRPVDAPAGTSERGRAGRDTFTRLQLGPAGGSGVQQQTCTRSSSPRGEGGGPFTHQSARAAAATGHVPCGWTIRSLRPEKTLGQGMQSWPGEGRTDTAGQGLAVSTATTEHITQSPCASVSSGVKWGCFWHSPPRVVRSQ